MQYFPPLDTVLNGLGIKPADLEASKASVKSDYLKFLILKIIEEIHVDQAWYLDHYPDVREAIQLGRLPSAYEHFMRSGYFEGRLPHELPFSAKWYRDYYKDPGGEELTDDGLEYRYKTAGYFDGRVGLPELLNILAEWSV